MPEKEVTGSAEVQEFLDSNGGIAVVDAYAVWCGPCKAIAPYVHKKSEETGVNLLKVNVDNSPELSSAYQIQAMPTFLVVKGKWNNVIKQIVGGGQANVDLIFKEAIAQK